MKLNKDEFSLERIYGRDFRFSQHSDYKLTLDSVLLGRFAELERVKTAVDLGCATGILCFVLYARKAELKITGVEIQKKLAETAVKNVSENKIENIKILNGDYTDKNFVNKLENYDLVLTNPPYMRINDGKRPLKDSEWKACFEVDMNFEKLIATTAKILNNSGKFVFSHIPRRLTEIVTVLDKYNFGIKRLQTVHSFENSESHFMMIEAVRNRKVQTIIEKPLIIFDSNRNYKGELGEIFGI